MERVSWLRGRTIQVRMTQRVSRSPSPKMRVRLRAEVKGEGTVTIKVQSFHKDPEVFAPYTEGDLTIESNTCKNGTAAPLEECTVVVKGSGKLLITGSDTVSIHQDGVDGISSAGMG